MWWCMPVILTIREAGAGESFEPGRQRLRLHTTAFRNLKIYPSSCSNTVSGLAPELAPLTKEQRTGKEREGKKAKNRAKCVLSTGRPAPKNKEKGRG
ncbi:hypothetical protein AAY473_021816 [Plecturocebus cupreus]